MKLTEFLVGVRRVVPYSPDVARWLGSVEAALLLQQLCFLAESADGPIVFGLTDADRDLALGRRPFESARAALVSKGLVRIDHGQQRRLLWQVDADAMEASWADFQTARNAQSGLREPRSLSARNAQTDLLSRNKNRVDPKGSPPDATHRYSAEADGLTRGWWEATDPRPMLKGGFLAARQIVEAALRARWSPEEIAEALPELGGTLVLWRLEDALKLVRRRRGRQVPAPPQEGRRW